MSKVDWINWKTNQEDIINPQELDDTIQENFQNYNTYATPVIYEQLRYETTKGGLTKEAFQISDVAPANEMAQDIMKNLDEIKEVMIELRKSIKTAAEEQKSIEKQQLIEALEEKINNEKMLLDQINNNKLEIQEYSTTLGESKEDIAYAVHERISSLQERLDSVRAL